MVRFRNLRGGQQEEAAPDTEAQDDDLAEDLGQEVEIEDGDEEILVEEQADDPEPTEEDLLAEDLEEDAGEAEADTGEADDPGSEAEDLAEDDVGDLAADGDESALKELAARMAVLQSNLESVQGTRGDIEDKLAKMEERMLRLGSLAEAVSSEYNPFIAENSPSEPTWGDRKAGPGEEEQAPPQPKPPQRAKTTEEPAREDDGPKPLKADPGTDEPAEQAPEPSNQVARDLQALEEAASAPQEPEPSEPEDPMSKLGALAGSDTEQEPKDAVTAAEAMAQGGPRLGSQNQLMEKFMMLEWVGLMLRRVGRANLLDLLEYYQTLGWLDGEMKNRVIRVAVGIDAPETGGESEWRGDLDLHERSLITIERLRGNDITAADVESLRMDMRRFFGE